MSDETEDPQPLTDEPPAEAAAAGEDAPKEKKAKKAKEPKQKKDKTAPEKKAKGKSKGKGKDSSGGLSIATHPRAGAQVRRAKGWGGLAGFGAAAYFSYKAGVPPEQVGLRALMGGIGGYMIAWACALTVWRHIVVAELRSLAERGKPGRSNPTGKPALAEADDGQTPSGGG